MKAHAPVVDYSRYFALKQRVYLINISEERDREHFESLSGIIVGRSSSAISIQIPYSTDQESPQEVGTRQVTYKVTSESLGGGIQMMADLIGITADNIFQLQLRGNLEMYQRRQTPRVDITVGLFQIRRDTSLAVYRKEFKRILQYINTNGLPPNLKLRKTTINLSAGGLRLTLEPREPLSPLALFFLDLDDGQPPMCAVTELVWNRLEVGVRLCGHRFVHIRKSDQERLKNLVQTIQKQQGVDVPPVKVNWELLDRMTLEE